MLLFQGVYLIIKKIICIIPKYPKIGYNKLIKLENPNCPINIDTAHIHAAYIRYVFLFLVVLLKNPYPDPIAVVNIAIKITIPYICLTPFPSMLAIYTIGIST